MCTHPILIDNPYYGGVFKAGPNSKALPIYRAKYHDTVSQKIPVPCGRCSQCASMRQGFYLQRIQMESLRSHLYMFTLTYNDESLIYTDVGEYHIAVPYLPDIQNMFKRLRKRGYMFRVSYVSEYGKKRFRPHFHGIFALDKSLGSARSLEKKFYKILFNEWKRNYSDDVFHPDWRPLFTPQYTRCRCTTFDFHYIEPVMNHDNDVSFYVSKYITKYDSRTEKLLQKISLDPTLDDQETLYLKKKIRPVCNTSKDFGDWKYPLIMDYIKKCAIRETEYLVPQFYDIHTGKAMPMTKYYWRHLPADFFEGVEECRNLKYGNETSTIISENSTIIDLSSKRDHDILQDKDFNRVKRKIENSSFF